MNYEHTVMEILIEDQENQFYCKQNKSSSNFLERIFENMNLMLIDFYNIYIVMEVFSWHC